MNFGCGYLLLFTSVSFKYENMEIILGGSWMVIPTMSFIQLFAEVLMYCEGDCWCLHVKYTVYKHLIYQCMLGHQTLGVCDTYLPWCLRYKEKHGKDLLISCG